MKKLILIALLLLAIAPSAFAASAWTATAVIAQSGTVSGAVALPGASARSQVRSIAVYYPALDSATVGLQVSSDGGTTYADLRSLNNNTNIVFMSTAAMTTETGYLTFPGVDFRNFTHIKVKCSAAQTSASRTFYIYGSP